jgi:hypothetical protein
MRFKMIRRLHEDRMAARLVEESEGFLRGRALATCLTTGTEVPVWAEINWLAHGQPSDIRDHVRSEYGLERPTGSWSWAVTVLARELVACADEEEDTISLMQRDCLVPMELGLMHQVDGAVQPMHLVLAGVTKLRAHPRSHAL